MKGTEEGKYLPNLCANASVADSLPSALGERCCLHKSLSKAMQPANSADKTACLTLRTIRFPFCPHPFLGSKVALGCIHQ